MTFGMAAPGADAPGDEGPFLEVRPAKAGVLVGEPIGLDVTIVNPTTEAIEVGVRASDAPMAAEVEVKDNDGDRVYSGSTHPPMAGLTGPAPSTIWGGGPIPARIGPLSRRAMTLYPIPVDRRWERGRYEIRYAIGLPYRVVEAEPGRPPSTDAAPQRALRARGELAVEVGPPDEQALIGVLSDLATRVVPTGPPLDRALWALAERLDRFASATTPLDGPFPLDDAEEIARLTPLARRCRRLGDALRGLVLRRGAIRLDRAGQAMAALYSIADPIVLPALEAVIEQDDTAFLGGFEALTRFHGHPTARRVATEALGRDQLEVVIRALAWLEAEQDPISADMMKNLISRFQAEDRLPLEVLGYLEVFASARGYPRLRPEVHALLERADPGDMELRATALRLLARWGAPRSPEIERTLRDLAAQLDPPGLSADRILSILAAWDYDLKTGVLESLLLDDDPTGFIPSSALAYLARVDRQGYRDLRPRVIQLLDSRFTTVVVEAINLLSTWGVPLEPGTLKGLLDRGGAIQEATERYLAARSRA